MRRRQFTISNNVKADDVRSLLKASFGGSRSAVPLLIVPSGMPLLGDTTRTVRQPFSVRRRLDAAVTKATPPPGGRRSASPSQRRTPAAIR